MSTMGVILSAAGVFSTVEGYHDARGGYHEYRGGVQYHGGYHPLKFEYCGGYHEYCGRCSVPWGTQITKDFPPKVLNTPHGTAHTLYRMSNVQHYYTSFLICLQSNFENSHLVILRVGNLCFNADFSKGLTN